MAITKKQYRVVEAIETKTQKFEVDEIIELTVKQAEKFGEAVVLFGEPKEDTETPPAIPEEPEEAKRTSVRIVGTYLGQNIDIIYSKAIQGADWEAKAEEFAKKANCKIV